MGLSLVLAVAVVAVAFSASQVNGDQLIGPGAHLGRESGPKTEIKDAKTNKELQAMGRYCVSEYNKKEKNLQGNEFLNFKEVVSAEKQVVAGLKYFLHIAATTPDGATKTFDAELLLKPRARDMELMVFAPTFTPAVDATPAADSTPAGN